MGRVQAFVKACDAGADLGGGSPREREGDDGPGIDPARMDEVGDAGGEGARLARTRARDHEEVPVRAGRNLALAGIEVGEMAPLAAVGHGCLPPGSLPALGSLRSIAIRDAFWRQVCDTRAATPDCATG